MQNNSQINSVQNENSSDMQNGGFKIPALQPAPKPQPQLAQLINKIPQQVVAKQNINPKKIPQPPPLPQPAQIQQPIVNVNAPKNNRSRSSSSRSSRSRSRSSSSSGKSRSSNRSGNRSGNKDSKSNKSKLRSTRKPKHQNGNQHIIAKLFGKNNVNQKALHELIKMLQ
jgi:hypothetical protein